MTRTPSILIVLSAMLAAPLGAQGNDVIRKEGASPIATSVTFPAPKDVVFRIAYAVNTGPEKPDEGVAGFKSAANFLYVGDANAVPRANMKLAVVVWGTATHSLLTNDAYKAAKGAEIGR